VVSAQQQTQEQAAFEVVAGVCDPELPFITIGELGIVRAVVRRGDQLVAKIAPTYLGCPAVKVIEEDVLNALLKAGFNATVERQLNPAWTSDWISESGRKKLQANGIVMEEKGGRPRLFTEANSRGLPPLFPEASIVVCPHCGSSDTNMVSRFGSTPCKSQYCCNACTEPFELFKCH
jgi:ring-1,2-phenylacetyl-CoA epoxidase subunit PaaD